MKHRRSDSNLPEGRSATNITIWNVKTLNKEIFFLINKERDLLNEM